MITKINEYKKLYESQLSRRLSSNLTIKPKEILTSNIIVYHGTKHNFDNFQIKNKHDRYYSDNYFWFTDDIEVATKFAIKDINQDTDKDIEDNIEGYLYTVQINSKNHIIFDPYEGDLSSDTYVSNFMKPEIRLKYLNQFFNNGYDLVILKNSDTGHGFVNEYIVKDKNIIKILNKEKIV